MHLLGRSDGARLQALSNGHIKWVSGLSQLRVGFDHMLVRMCDLRWIKWQWDRFFSEYFIASMLHAHLFIYHIRFHPFYRPLRESSGIALLCFWTSAVEGGEGSASRPGRLLSSGKTRYPLYKRLDERHVRSGQVQEISPPPEFDSRTIQPIASRYTYWATRPTIYHIEYVILATKRIVLSPLGRISNS
jgi:hypothetical protein